MPTNIRTWNMRGRNFTKHKNRGFKRQAVGLLDKYERTKQDLVTSNLDAVFLQESGNLSDDFGGRPRANTQINHNNSIIYCTYHRWDKTGTGNPRCSMAILNTGSRPDRHTISPASIGHYSNLAILSKQRPVLGIKIPGNGGWIFNLHAVAELHQYNNVSPNSLSQASVRGTVNAIKNWVNGQKFVLVGDFNITPDIFADLHLGENMICDISQNGGILPRYHWTHNSSGKILDYAVGFNGVQSITHNQRQLGEHTSDHRWQDFAITW